MAGIIGQDTFLQNLHLLTSSDTLGHFSIFVGPKGQGKTTVARYTAELLDCPIQEFVAAKVDDVREIISQCQQLNSNRLFVIRDGEDMTTQAQNALLKLAEEPPQYAYLILTVGDLSRVLPTIKSRAKVYKLDTYRRDELKPFLYHPEDKLSQKLLDICENPGELIRFQSIDYVGLFTFSSKVKDKIFDISTLNVFNIQKSIDIKGTGEKGYPIDLFIKTLQYEFSQESDTSLRVSVMSVLNKYWNIFQNKSVAKLPALDMMLLDIQRCW